MSSVQSPPAVLPRLYAIVDTALTRSRGWEVPSLAAALMRGGATLVQLRAKSEDSAVVLAWADALVELGARHGATVIVNDRADIARMVGAAGVHVGQDDLGPDAVRRVVGPDAIVGLSTHGQAQFRAAAREPISYAAMGPVFETRTKASPDGVVGVQSVRQAVEAAGKLPVVGIGGITLDTARAVIDAGAASAAVVSDLLVGGNPERRAAEFVAALDR